MRLDILKQLNEERANRRAILLVTDLKSGAQTLIRESELASTGDMRQAYERAFRAGRSSTIEGPGGALFVNVFAPPARLVMIGAVHISQALYPMAQAVGYDVTIVDPRTAFATPERFPGVPLHAVWPDEVLPEIGIDRYTAMATLTHDPKIDDPALLHALKSECFYIGALGSRKTHGTRVERLKKAGITDNQLARIHAPIGLNIGAQSPAEIAVSILAEITAALRLDPEQGR